MLTTDQTDLIRDFGLGMVATIRADGGPAVSPKGTFLVLDEKTVAFADIRSPSTTANLGRDNRVEVTFLDPFARKSVRLAGVAKTHPKGSADHDALISHWQSAWPDLAPRIRALIVIDLTRAETILTPPYDDGVTEAEFIEMYKTKYAGIYP